MKILVIARGVPSKKHPQLGCFELDQAKALKKAGNEVILLALDGSIGKRWKKIGISQTNIDGVICYEVFGPPTIILKKFIGLEKGLNIESQILKPVLSRIIKKHWKPEVIHAHFLMGMKIGTVLSKRFHIPLVGTEHLSSVSEVPVAKYIKNLAQSTYPYVDKIIAVSENLKNKIKEYSGRESIVIHNLIDPSNLEKAVEKTNNDKFTIVAVGSLIYRKGFDVLIKAFAESDLRNKNVMVKIIGEGEEKDNLNELIKDFNLGNKFFLVGKKNKGEIFELLHKADLFVLSSRLENFSVSLIEATANGVPAVATLCGGVEEYPVEEVKKIPVENVGEMRKALEAAYSSRHDVDRISIQNQTLLHFSPKVIVKQLEAIYKEAIAVL